MSFFPCLRLAQQNATTTVHIDDIFHPDEVHDSSKRVTVPVPDMDEEENDFQLLRNQKEKDLGSSNATNGFFFQKWFSSRRSEKDEADVMLKSIKRKRKQRKKSSLLSVTIPGRKVSGNDVRGENVNVAV